MSAPASGSIGDLSDDSYVAQVLAREAHESSLKYSVSGLEAYMPKRPTNGPPKPNTRFLRNIIRETDTHNAALRRKEEHEARERMRQLRAHASSHSSRSSRRHDAASERRLSDTSAARHDYRKHHSHRSRHQSRSASPARDRSRTRRRRDETDEWGGGDRVRQRRSRTDSWAYRDEQVRPRRERSASSRSRSWSPHREPSHDHRRRHRRKADHSDRAPESRSLERRDRQPEPEKHSAADRGPMSHRKHARSSDASPSPHTGRNTASEDESDPLEDLVGPLPPRSSSSGGKAVCSRGRGLQRSYPSNIDAHFALDYDPSTDVHLDDDDYKSVSNPPRRPVAGLMTQDDDWEMSLEALRDRTRWKQKGEERLREAGFDDSTLRRWKNNTRSTVLDDSERGLDDVKWTKKGEGREWDRGKVVTEDGHIDVKASW